MPINIAPEAHLAQKKYNGFCENTTDSVNPIENVYNGFCDYFGASRLPTDPAQNVRVWFPPHRVNVQSI